MIPTKQGLKAYLPEDYAPSEFDVICGRGVEYYKHSGNVLFRKTIEENIGRYEAAETKLQKTLLVLNVLEIIKSKSTSGPTKFVRWDHHRSRWYEINDEVARQKVGQTIRETLAQRGPHNKKAKSRRKRNMQEGVTRSDRLHSATNAKNAEATTEQHSRTSEPNTFPGVMNFRDLEFLRLERATSAPSPAKINEVASHQHYDASTKHTGVASLPPIRSVSAPPQADLYGNANLEQERPETEKKALADTVEAALANCVPAARQPRITSVDWFAKETGGVLPQEDVDLSGILESVFAEKRRLSDNDTSPNC